MSEINLGSLIDGEQSRDAIHVAVVPMVASEMLRPGQRVGVVSSGVAGPSSEVVGIVDPYLTDVVPRGAAFWLCLLPNTVTGMRHHWRHPLFDGDAGAAVPSDVEVSKRWLKDAAAVLGIRYDDLIEGWCELENGDYINNGECIRDIWYDLRDEFWKHHKIVTGRDVPEEKRGGFTCSC